MEVSSNWFSEFVADLTEKKFEVKDPLITSLNALDDSRQKNVRQKLNKLISEEISDMKEEEQIHYKKRIKLCSTSEIVTIELTNQTVTYNKNSPHFVKNKMKIAPKQWFTTNYEAAVALYAYLEEYKYVRYEYTDTKIMCDNPYFICFEDGLRKRRPESEYTPKSYTMDDCVAILERGKDVTFEQNSKESDVVHFTLMKITKLKNTLKEK